MKMLENELKVLLERGKKQGYLTYETVGKVLPDEANGSETLDNVIVALENAGIEMCDKAPGLGVDNGDGDDLKADVEFRALQAAEKLPRPSDDPIRMYLSQMAEIPLLTRDEEISLAKTIEITSCLLYTSPSPRDLSTSRMPSSA